MNPFDNPNDPKTQGSEAWLAERNKGIGGSEIAIILGLSPYKTAYRLWLEKTGLVQVEDIGKLPHVMRGKLAEPIARKKLEDHLGYPLTPHVYEPQGIVRFSSDGTNRGQGTFCEIKAMGLEAHNAVMQEIVPEHYMPQIIWGFGIDPLLHQCYFVSVRPEDDHRLHIKLIERTSQIDELFKHYRAKAEEFMELVRTKTPPPLTDRDVIKIDSDVFQADVEAWKEAKTAFKEAERVLELREEALKSYLGEVGSIEGTDIKITRYSRKGNVSWLKIPQVKALPAELVEQYRAPASVAVRITPKKEGETSDA